MASDRIRYVSQKKTTDTTNLRSNVVVPTQVPTLAPTLTQVSAANNFVNTAMPTTTIYQNGHRRGSFNPDIVRTPQTAYVNNPDPTVVRSNQHTTGGATPRGTSTGESSSGVDVVNTPTQDLVDMPTGVQTAGVNWLLPLVVLGGFFAASRLKKKNKKPTAKKVKL